MAGRPTSPLTNPPNRIREFRLRLGYTLERLGDQLGVAGETVRKWETGENPISVKHLEGLATVMGLRAMDLLNA